jgi:O-methyltransferase involved in polyketide biosynthesis
MFFMILKRHLPTYLMWVFGSLVVWILATLSFDGLLPTLAFFAFIGTIILVLPVLMYLDYREVKSHLSNLKNISKGEGDATEYVDMAIAKIAEKAGVPEFMVPWLASAGKKAVTRFNEQKIAKKTEQSSSA